LVTFCTSKK